MPSPKLSPVFLTDWLSMKVSLTLPLGFDNLLEQLTKFRKILTYWLIIKDKIKDSPRK